MNLFDFVRKYPTEQSCKDHLRNLRLQQGITCKNCQVHTKHYWLKNVEKFQCSVCKSRTNLKSGTIFQDSKLPLQKWFHCIFLMTSTKKPISSLELQRQLGLKHYQRVWNMTRKIRLSMGDRDSKYQLNGDIEMDEGYFEIVKKPKRDELGNRIDEERPLSRGRGSERQKPVLVMCESTPREQTNPNKKNRELGYVKMIVLDRVRIREVNPTVQEHIDPKSHILTDNYPSNNRLSEVVKKHTSVVVPPTQSMKVLPWVHTMISNCKRELLGVHHSIGKDYLQLYLNEFCYKLNRRNFTTDLFDRLLLSSLDGYNF